MESAPLLDCAGRRRSPAMFPAYTGAGRRVTRDCSISPMPWRTKIGPRVASRSLSGKAGASLTRSPGRHSTGTRPWILTPSDVPTRGRPCSASGLRAQLRRVAVQGGIRRRFAPTPAPPRARYRDVAGRRSARPSRQPTDSSARHAGGLNDLREHRIQNVVLQTSQSKRPNPITELRVK
jgi:hypothetical protein